MCDEWMPSLRLTLTLQQFHQLPRHPAYRYEYVEGQAVVSPHARFYHARIDLQTHAGREIPALPGGVELRPVRHEDFAELAEVFAAAFRQVQPFAGLDDDYRQLAARTCLGRTHDGGDGPWIEQASFVAVEEQRPVGAILVTLLPEGDPCERDTYQWSAPPPADCIVRRLGRPHLTWIFVSPLIRGNGLGTVLLSAAGRELAQLGFTKLLSTFLLGNESSMLWHWRSGFELLSYPGSPRRRQEQST